MKNKKGFTIVELVIVIAVVAVLAAVMIPTFAGIVKSANISSDIQTARNMGVILAGVKPTNAFEAVEALKANGFETLHPKTKFYKFYWIEDLNVVVLTDDGIRPIFPEEMVNAIFDEKLWHDLTLQYRQPESSVAPEPPISPDEPTQCRVTYEVNNEDYLDLYQCVFTDTVNKGQRLSFTLAPKSGYVITRVLVVMSDGESKLETQNRDPITDRMEFQLYATGDIKVSITVEEKPSTFVGVTFTCNKPEYLAKMPQNTTVAFGEKYTASIAPTATEQYWITAVTVYKGGKQIQVKYPLPGKPCQLDDITMTDDLEINIHVVKYCTVNFVGEGIKTDSGYTKQGLMVERGVGCLMDAGDLRKHFIPDGYDIESVTVKMGERTLENAYDPVKQILLLSSITDNTTVTFTFKEKSN